MNQREKLECSISFSSMPCTEITEKKQGLPTSHHSFSDDSNRQQSRINSISLSRITLNPSCRKPIRHWQCVAHQWNNLRYPSCLGVGSSLPCSSLSWEGRPWKWEQAGSSDTQVTYRAITRLLRASTKAGAIISYLDGAGIAWKWYCSLSDPANNHLDCFRALIRWALGFLCSVLMQTLHTSTVPTQALPPTTTDAVEEQQPTHSCVLYFYGI